MGDEAVVPLMRRLGWAEGPASFFMSDWVKADLATHPSLPTGLRPLPFAG